MTARSREILPWIKVWDERLTPCQHIYKFQRLPSKPSQNFGLEYITVFWFPFISILIIYSLVEITAWYSYPCLFFFHGVVFGCFWTPKLLGNFGASRGAQAPPTKKAFIGKGIGTSAFIQIPAQMNKTWSQVCATDLLHQLVMLMFTMPILCSSWNICRSTLVIWQVDVSVSQITDFSTGVTPNIRWGYHLTIDTSRVVVWPRASWQTVRREVLQSCHIVPILKNPMALVLSIGRNTETTPQKAKFPWLWSTNRVPSLPIERNFGLQSWSLSELNIKLAVSRFRDM